MNDTLWTTTDIPDWLTVTPAFGRESGPVRIEYETNHTGQERKAAIQFQAGEANATLSIIQSSLDTLLSVEPDSLLVAPPAGQVQLQLSVTPEVSWETSDIPSWIKVSPDQGSGSQYITLDYEQNPTAGKRKGSIIFLSGSKSRMFRLIQSGEATLSLNKAGQNFPADGGTTSLEVSTNGAEWETSGIPEWISLSPTNGKGNTTVTIECQPNTSINAREATITFSAGNETKTFRATQDAAGATISLNKAGQNFPADGGTTSLEVSTNGAEWETSGIPEWISLSPANGKGNITVTIECQPNTSINAREATITFAAGNETKTFRATQDAAGATISLNKAGQNFPADGGTTSLEVSTNGAEWNTNNIPEWISLSPANGKGNTTVTIECQPNTSINAREATITFAAGNETKTFRATQDAAGATISLSKTEQNFPANGESTSLEVATNGAEWETSGIPEWISLSPANGKGNTTVNIECQPNTSINAREATITFSAGNETKTFRATQDAAGATISLSKTEQNFPTRGGTTSLEVITNGAEWNTNSIPEWISLSPTTGKGSTTVSIECQPNASSNSREATITFAVGEKKQNFYISQNAAGITISLSKWEQNFPTDGGTTSLEVSTNDAEWYTSGIPEWISLSPINGKGNTTVNIKCQPNTATNSRDATIAFTAGNIIKTFYVFQAAASPTLSLSSKEENFLAQGGNLSINITTNGAEWNSSNIPEWITLSPTSGQGSATVNIECQPNTALFSREATIYFHAGDLQETLHITQAAARQSISVEPTTTHFPADGGNTRLNVTINGNVWTSEGLPDWLSLSPSNGWWSEETQLTCQANTTGLAREATITFKSGEASCTLQVTQAPNDMLEIIKTDYSVKATGGIVDIALQTNITYTVSVDVSWIKETTGTDLPDNTHRFAVEANPGKQARTGTITFSGSGITRTATIRQSENGDISVDVDDWIDDGQNHGGTAE